MCGSDGQTYSNECFLEMENCRDTDIKISVAYSGECKFLEFMDSCTRFTHIDRAILSIHRDQMKRWSNKRFVGILPLLILAYFKISTLFVQNKGSERVKIQP